MLITSSDLFVLHNRFIIFWIDFWINSFFFCFLNMNFIRQLGDSVKAMLIPARNRMLFIFKNAHSFCNYFQFFNFSIHNSWWWFIFMWVDFFWWHKFSNTEKILFEFKTVNDLKPFNVYSDRLFGGMIEWWLGIYASRTIEMLIQIDRRSRWIAFWYSISHCVLKFQIRSFWGSSEIIRQRSRHNIEQTVLLCTSICCILPIFNTEKLAI